MLVENKLKGKYRIISSLLSQRRRPVHYTFLSLLLERTCYLLYEWFLSIKKVCEGLFLCRFWLWEWGLDWILFTPWLQGVGGDIQLPYRKSRFIHCWGIIEGRNAMISQDFYRIDSDLSKGQMFLSSVKMGYSKWSVHIHLPWIVLYLSAVL